MSYFDPKEEVIDLKLTPYGEYLLSIGKLSPSYYAFFDNDIIYDDNWAGVSTEGQNQIESRIQEETPRIHTQTSFSDREKDFIEFSVSGEADVMAQFIDFSEVGLIQDNTDIALEKIALSLLKPQAEKSKDVYFQPLGKYDSTKQKAPGWNIGFLKAPLSASSDYLNVTGSSYINIPQLECNLQYEIQRNSGHYNRTYVEEETTPPGLLPDPDNDDTIFYGDGSTIAVVEDSIVLFLEESNTDFEVENFEIEIFEVSEITNHLNQTEEYLRPLVFQEPLQGVKRMKYSVEAFFDLALDEEIPEEEICPLIQKDTRNHIYETKIFDCEAALSQIQVQNFYADVDDTKDVCN